MAASLEFSEVLFSVLGGLSKIEFLVVQEKSICGRIIKNCISVKFKMRFVYARQYIELIDGNMIKILEAILKLKLCR